MQFKSGVLGGLWASIFRSSPDAKSYGGAVLPSSLFIVSIHYISPLSEVDKYIEAHRAFLDDNYKKNIFMASGRKIPRTGGVILASNTERSHLENIMRQDPFYQNGISEYSIEEFSPTMHNQNFLKFFEPGENKSAIQKQGRPDQDKSGASSSFYP